MVKFHTIIINLIYVKSRISYFNDDVAFRSLPVLCSNGHNIVEGVSIRFYNCMCKNLIRQLTEKGRRGTSAKIRKLNSN